MFEEKREAVMAIEAAVLPLMGVNIAETGEALKNRDLRTAPKVPSEQSLPI
jgi:hypothetical protein